MGKVEVGSRKRGGGPRPEKEGAPAKQKLQKKAQKKR
jgi:hypothetical protein